MNNLKILVVAVIFVGCHGSGSVNKEICEVIELVHLTFLSQHKNEMKYMNFERFYICNFEDFQVDPSIEMYRKPNLSTYDNIHFDNKQLNSIASNCLKLPSFKVLDSKVALDSLRKSNTTNKVIWGISNFRKKANSFYLIFSCNLSSRSIIADEYLVENKGGKYQVLDVNPISH